VIQGRDNLSYYSSGTGAWRKGFCKKCGVHIMNEPAPLTPEQVNALSPEGKASHDGAIDLQPVNIRILNDFDLDAIKDKVHRHDGWNTKPDYVNP